jgi:hypothetical protein
VGELGGWHSDADVVLGVRNLESVSVDAPLPSFRI